MQFADAQNCIFVVLVDRRFFNSLQDLLALRAKEEKGGEGRRRERRREGKKAGKARRN